MAVLNLVERRALSRLVLQSRRATVNAFTVFSVLRPRIHGISAAIGSNGHIPCFNKTKGSPFMLSMHHISHSMLGHTVALSSLKKTVNAFTVFCVGRF